MTFRGVDTASSIKLVKEEEEDSERKRNRVVA